MVKKITVLDEADKITSGERRETYGHPRDNHHATAMLWNAFLNRRGIIVEDLTESDVCMLNALQKISRYANAPHRDSLVDVCGYMRNIEMVEDEIRNERTLAVNRKCDCACDETDFTQGA